jgi:hypothetical protein
MPPLHQEDTLLGCSGARSMSSLSPLRLALHRQFRRLATSSKPPPPPTGPYKSIPHPEKKPIEPLTSEQAVEVVFPETPKPEPLDPARGVAASQRVVREGVLDPRYRGAAVRYTAIIVALPILIYTSWILYERQILGVEQKRRVEMNKDRQNVPGIFGARERKTVEG